MATVTCTPACNQPWQEALPIDLLVHPDVLKATVEIYEESILLRTYDQSGTSVRYISADDLCASFTKHSTFKTGLLTPTTLWAKTSHTGTTTAVWRPPQVWPAALQTEAFGAPARFRLPMPGLVVISNSGRAAPWIFAAKERPTSPEDQLYKAPTFNTFQNGRVCPGTHWFPTDHEAVPESFFESYFSLTGDTKKRSHRHPDNLVALWEEIDGQEAYPTDDLIPQCTVKEAMGLPEQTSRRW